MVCVLRVTSVTSMNRRAVSVVPFCCFLEERELDFGLGSVLGVISVEI